MNLAMTSIYAVLSSITVLSTMNVFSKLDTAFCCEKEHGLSVGGVTVLSTQEPLEGSTLQVCSHALLAGQAIS